MLATIEHGTSVHNLCSHLAHSCSINHSRQAVQSCLLALDAAFDCVMLRVAQCNVSAVQTAAGPKAVRQQSRCSIAYVCLGCVESCH